MLSFSKNLTGQAKYTKIIVYILEYQIVMGVKNINLDFLQDHHPWGLNIVPERKSRSGTILDCRFRIKAGKAMMTVKNPWINQQSTGFLELTKCNAGLIVNHST